MTAPETPRLALLDRDGTLIDVVRDEETGTITTAFHPSQVRFLDGVFAGLETLVDAGYLLAIVTNQPGPAKGQFSREAVYRTNDFVVSELAARSIPIARVGVCLHHPDGGPGGDPTLIGPCACRKPKPGLLIDAMRELGAAPSTTWMIGDSMADVEAAKAAGVRAGLLFATNRCELCPLRGGPSVTPDVHAPKFFSLVHAIVGA